MRRCAVTLMAAPPLSGLREQLLSPELLQQSGVYQLATQCGLAPPSRGGGPAVTKSQEFGEAFQSKELTAGVSAYLGEDQSGARSRQAVVRKRPDRDATFLDTPSLAHASVLAKETAGAVAAAEAKLQEVSTRPPCRAKVVTTPSCTKPDEEVTDDEHPTTPEKQALKRSRRAAAAAAEAASSKFGCGSGSSSPPNRTGLRYFAVKVCDLVRARGRTSYHAVGDEMVKELGGLTDVGGQQDDKNIRRRVYDAINVLKALGIVKQVAGKDLEWVGLPSRDLAGQAMNCGGPVAGTAGPSSSGGRSVGDASEGMGGGGGGKPSSSELLRSEKQDLIRQNQELIGELQDLVRYHGSLEHLLSRNAVTEPSGWMGAGLQAPAGAGTGGTHAAAGAGAGTAQGQIPYPFVLIRTERDGPLGVSHAVDHSEYLLDFGGSLFSLHDGLMVLQDQPAPQLERGQQEDSKELGLGPRRHHQHQQPGHDGAHDPRSGHGSKARSGSKGGEAPLSAFSGTPLSAAVAPADAGPTARAPATTAAATTNASAPGVQARGNGHAALDRPAFLQRPLVNAVPARGPLAGGADSQEEGLPAAKGHRRAEAMPSSAAATRGAGPPGVATGAGVRASTGARLMGPLGAAQAAFLQQQRLAQDAELHLQRQHAVLPVQCAAAGRAAEGLVHAAPKRGVRRRVARQLDTSAAAVAAAAANEAAARRYGGDGGDNGTMRAAPAPTHMASAALVQAQGLGPAYPPDEASALQAARWQLLLQQQQQQKMQQLERQQMPPPPPQQQQQQRATGGDGSQGLLLCEAMTLCPTRGMPPGAMPGLLHTGQQAPYLQQQQLHREQQQQLHQEQQQQQQFQQRMQQLQRHAQQQQQLRR